MKLVIKTVVLVKLLSVVCKVLGLLSRAEFSLTFASKLIQGVRCSARFWVSAPRNQEVESNLSTGTIYVLPCIQDNSLNLPIREFIRYHLSF